MFTRCRKATEEEANQLRERMCELLSETFDGFSLRGEQLIKKLKGRFIDASVFRDKTPNAYIAVPDIVVYYSRRLIGLEKHWPNLDRKQNTQVQYQNAYFKVEWNYDKGAKYMYSESWKNSAQENKNGPIAKQFCMP